MTLLLVVVTLIELVITVKPTLGQAVRSFEVDSRNLPDETKPGMYETLIERLEKQEAALRHLQITLVEASKETHNKNQQIEHLNSMLSEIMVKLGEKDNQVEKLENELREIRKKLYVEHPTEPISDVTKSLRGLHPHGSHEDVTHKDSLLAVDGFQQQRDKRELYNQYIETQEKQGRTAGAVAFSASIHGDHVVNKHEVLVFGDELVNEGSGYNRGDGIFTVPQSGVYVFTWSITAGTHSETIKTDIYTNLMQNGFPVGNIDSDSDEHNFGSATGVVVLRCSYGDHVYVRTDSPGKVNSDYQAKSTFSGWLLF
ncbi:uncharacterized protein [Argopecten irradians]|uniref:uncharacterized protein n=1 Tax=Argopecten irradians TaxID=31199 RepID=UPI003712ADD2